jgi:hypothetical protein
VFCCKVELLGWVDLASHLIVMFNFALQIVQQQMPHLAAGMLQAAQAQAAAAAAASQAASKPKASRVYDEVRVCFTCFPPHA